jgi:mitochondrial inner membrane protease subunit 2
MPPASRGLLFFRVLRRYSSTPPLPPKSRSAKLPTTAKKHASELPPREPPRPPQKPLPQPRLRSQQYEIVEPNPSTPYRPFSAPRGAPPLLERLLSRFSPHVRSAVRFAFHLIPWIPPFLLLQLHFPMQIMWVTGPSMSPFLNTNFSNDGPNTQDCVLVDRFRELKKKVGSFDRWGTQQLERGMVIVFHTPHDPNILAVKRIVGLPGDRVQPLPGYGGNTENPPKVVVPWNHLWVEGDVDDRNKSVDSNWYGPISKCLVIGQVKYVLSPWYSPSAVLWEEHSYPAQRRVEENAVFQMDPSIEAEVQAFPSRADLFLQALRRHPEKAAQNAKTAKGKRELQRLLQQCHQVEVVGDPPTVELAQTLIAEVERLLGTQTDRKVAQADLNALVTS